ncbi:MAG: penicillin acylase family protein, partial [Kofleriaceae bacterium]|nr:penicillin acylase family protein [Kofleriaceae bacterium]
MWQGTIPGEFMPQVINPAPGYIASANDRAAGAWYPLSIGLGTGGHGDTPRSARLRELLDDMPDNISADGLLDHMQQDCVKIGRRDMVAMGAHLASLKLLSPNAWVAASAVPQANWITELVAQATVT